MKRSRNTPMWPYLAIVWCLFVLSLSAPRSWRRIAVDPETVGRPSVTSHDSPIEAARHAPTIVAADPVDAAIGRFLPNKPASLGGSSTAQTQVRVDDTSDRLAMRTIRRNRAPLMRLPKVDLSVRNSYDPFDPYNPATPDTLWSAPRTLLARLDQLALVSETSDWAIKASGTLRRLTANTPTLPEEILDIIDELAGTVEAAAPLADSLSQATLRTDLRQAQHALKRRVDLWRLAHQLDQAEETNQAIATSRGPQLSRCLADVAALTDDSPEGRAWNSYLMLDALARLAEETDSISVPETVPERGALVRRVLSRIERARRSEPQRQFVEQAALASLDAELKHWAAQPVNISRLLARLERYEEMGLATDAQRLAEDGRSLSWSAQEECEQFGRTLERHYRNANLRVALSGELVRRLLPEQKDVVEDVYDNILGADVEGVSQTSTRLSVRLVPDDRRIRFDLEASGLVHSDTASYAGPATFYSLGSTSFQARKLFLISAEEGLQNWPAEAYADGDSSLMGIDTDFDGVPVVGGLVRRMARSQHRKAQGSALWEMESRVAGTASERLDRQAEQQMEALQKNITDRLLTPLRNLSLEPTPIDMHTTEQRAVARMRLAGSHQLGAHTPRPRAPSDSYLSVQMHQSAINNALENLKLDGKELRLRELYQTIIARIRGLDDISQVEVPDDIPSSARVTMAGENAIRVRFHDGQAEITLSMDQVRFRRTTVPNVQVHAFYKPRPDGLHARLVREGAVQLQTDRHLKAREEIVLRSMFAKLLSKNRAIELIRGKFVDDARIADLQINQFLVEDGWIGLAIGPERVQAQRPTTTR